MRTTRLIAILGLLVIALTPTISTAQADNCATPATEMSPMPFGVSYTGARNDDVNLAFNLGGVCAAGPGGTPAASLQDAVFHFNLNPLDGHILCDFSSPLMMTLVVSTVCGDPLAVSACVYGGTGTSFSFDTFDLDLPDGDYYVWQEDIEVGQLVTVTCTRSPSIFADSFEGGSTGAWSSAAP